MTRLKNIISYFLCFGVEALILLLYASRLFTAKYSLKKRLAVLCLLYAFLFIVSLFNIKWLNMSIYLIANLVFLVTQYDLKWGFAFFHSAILAAVMGMCELVVYSIMERFTPNFFVQMEHFYNTVIFIVCSKILFFAVIYLVTHFLKDQQKQERQHDTAMLLLIFIPVTAIFTMLTFVGISDRYALTPALNWMIALSALFLLSTNLLVFGINHYNQRKNREYTEMQLLLQKETDITEYYKMLLAQSENQSILIHDIKKHLQSIELLNEQHDHDKISAYIGQLMLSSDLKETVRICDHELLNAILSRYKRQCGSLQISFLTDIRSGTIDFLGDSDLTALFCNLLENAIEAARNAQNPFIEITTSNRDKTPFALITLINSCGQNPLTGQSQTPITTKPDKQKHGFGIKSIRKIVKKHHGDIQMYYNEESLTFHTIITLRKG